jgi:hypothetical protein
VGNNITYSKNCNYRLGATPYVLETNLFRVHNCNCLYEVKISIIN